MNLFDFLVGLPFFGGAGTMVRHGTVESLENAPAEPSNLTVLYTCVKILSDSFSRIPLHVKNGKGEVIPHRIATMWNNQHSTWQNPQVARSTLEWERNIYGNGLKWIKGDRLYQIPASCVMDYRFDRNKGLQYEITNLSTEKHREIRFPRFINAENILHFRGVSSDGVFGLSPLSAAMSTHQLMQNATRTASAFYRNNAASPHAIEKSIPTGGSYQEVLADKKRFEEGHAGVENAGKPIHLSLGEKIVPLAVKFADQELIKTLEFTRDTITSVYQIPNWMLSANDSNQNVEQQTRAFVSSTIAGICNIYKHEIGFKMLSPKEKALGFHVEFDIDVLIETTFSEKIKALKEAVTNAMMTPNQVAKRLGLPPIKGKFGNYHFQQAQNIPLEEYDHYNPLIKDDPTLKSNTNEEN